MVDIDGDGLISYEEYMLFRTLLSLPQRKVRKRGGIERRNESASGEPNQPADCGTNASLSATTMRHSIVVFT